MEGSRPGRISTGSRSEPARVHVDHHVHVVGQNVVNSNHALPPQKRSAVVKMFNKVQVVYYLTRNGQLEHPHYLEVSHLATQPLRLRDVIERLTILRGKTMPCQYSWSCKRSYKNGYVWNDLSENDVIYASEGSEYVLKGSEIIQHRDFSEVKAQEFEFKGRKEAKGIQVKPKSKESSVIRTSVGHSFRQTEIARNHLKQNDNDDVVDNEEEAEDEDEDEDKGSCNNSSNPPPHDDQCPLIMQMEQDESYSLPSTSSTNSDKPAPPPAPTPTPPKTPIATRSTISKKVNVEKDNDPCSLSRNTVLLQLIACGGGSAGPKSKPKPMNTKPNNNSFNFNSMRSSIMPCLKQQLSTRRGICMMSSDSTTNSSNISSDSVPVLKDHCSCNCKTDNRREEVEEDEDMIMVKFMSENPRFGNLQSQEKEYFSGTIVETMATHHQHTPSSGSASSLSHLPTPVFAKSSSYNEQRSSKPEMQAAVEAKQEDKETQGVKVKGIIKCIPRRKSYGSNSSSKSNKI